MPIKKSRRPKKSGAPPPKSRAEIRGDYPSRAATRRLPSAPTIQGADEFAASNVKKKQKAKKLKNIKTS
jgi:hypothetical protein